MLPPMELMSAIGIIGPRLMRKSKKPDISLIPEGTELYNIYMYEEQEENLEGSALDKGFSVSQSHQNIKDVTLNHKTISQRTSPSGIGSGVKGFNKIQQKIGIYIF